MPLGAESFAFPGQCQQVFFSDDIPRSTTHGGDWKVVCSTDIWGRRSDCENETPELHCLYPGSDANYLGLEVNL
jgi:hypothetical protein